MCKHSNLTLHDQCRDCGLLPYETDESQSERLGGTLHVIDRDEVPVGSFAYGQDASVPGFDVRPDLYAVCTYCSKARVAPDRNGYDFDQVLVAHFLHRTFEDAAETARNLVRDGGHVVIVNALKV